MLSLVVLHAAKTTPQTASLAPNPAETVSDLPLSNGYFRPTPHGGTGARCERPLRWPTICSPLLWLCAGDPNARTTRNDAAWGQTASTDTAEDKVARYAEAAAEQEADAKKAEAQRKERKASVTAAGPKHAGSSAGSRWLSGWSPEQMAALFESGRPSNDLSEVGLVVHGFDFTEDEQDPWKPCEQEWCYNMTRAWSSTIVNAKQSSILNPSGIVFSPSATKVLCSSLASTALSEAPGCEGAPYRASQLKDMLKKAMHNKQTGFSTSNEVLIDASYYTGHLPASVAAIMFFADATAEDKIIATRAYVALLDKYQVSEAEIPLLKVNRGLDELGNPMQSPSSVATVMDVSASARSFLAKATKAKEVEKLLRHHPNRKGDVLRKKLQSRSHEPDPDAAGRES